MKIVELTRTCIASPSQWEGKLEDGRYAYLRYRFGNFTMSVGDSPKNAVFGEGVISVGHGLSMDGVMADDEMLSILMEWGVEHDVYDNIVNPWNGWEEEE